jgi:hypothetical protein
LRDHRTLAIGIGRTTGHHLKRDAAGQIAVVAIGGSGSTGHRGAGGRDGDTAAHRGLRGDGEHWRGRETKVVEIRWRRAARVERRC